MDTNKTYTVENVCRMNEYEKTDLIMELQKENTELVDSINKRNETIGSLKKENEKLKRERDLLNLDTGRLNDEIKEKDKEIEKVKNERDWLDSCYRIWIEESKSRAEKIKKLEKEKDDLDCVLHNKIEELEGDIECRKMDLEYKNDQIDHLIKRLDDQRKKIEDLENGDVLPYFIRKVVGEKLKEDPCCWAMPAKKRNYIEDSFCKSIPCSEAIKQLEKKVDDIPCVKSKKTKSELDDAIKDYIMKSPTPICWNDGSSTKAKEAYDYIIEDMKRTREFYDKYCVCKWFNNDSPYDKIAEHMMRKYKALRNAGFDHDTALSFIPMWSDE